MIVFAHENDRAHGPIGMAQRPLGIHRLRQDACVTFKSSKVVLHQPAAEGQPSEKPTRHGVRVLAHIEKISS